MFFVSSLPLKQFTIIPYEKCAYILEDQTQCDYNAPMINGDHDFIVFLPQVTGSLSAELEIGPIMVSYICCIWKDFLKLQGICPNFLPRYESLQTPRSVNTAMVLSLQETHSKAPETKSPKSNVSV